MKLKILNENNRNISLIMLNEDESDIGWFSNTWSGLKNWLFGPDNKGGALADTGNAIGSAYTGIGDWIGSSAKGLLNYMRQHPDASAAGLIGAGLLGTYYLFKKFSKNKNLSKEEIETARSLDKMSPEEAKRKLAQLQAK